MCIVWGVTAVVQGMELLFKGGVVAAAAGGNQALGEQEGGAWVKKSLRPGSNEVGEDLWVA